jgi:DNA-binding response OmpR family regulator
MYEITIIEDNYALNNGIALALKNYDYNITQIYKLKEFDKNRKTDLIILDINLPDGNGFDFLKQLRTYSDVSVIILTANDLETDEVMGLELGADDYIKKPFSLMVLRLRIEKVLKRKINYHNYKDNKYDFDFEKMKFYSNDSLIELSKTEQKLLKILIANANRVVTRDILIDKIWSDASEYVDENALSVTVNRLRKKLNAEKIIQTVYGIGYKWRTE